MTTDYNKQAEDFLQATNTTLEVVEAVPQTPPKWEQGLNGLKHIKYAITIKNPKHSYTFDYWGSINDYEKVQLAQARNSFGSKERDELREFLKENHLLANQYKTTKDIENMIHEVVKPTPYDILACLSPMYENNFEDWCSSFGYDTDSMKAHETYQACIEQDRNIRKLFTHEELEQLAEIN